MVPYFGIDTTIKLINFGNVKTYTSKERKVDFFGEVTF
jgi:hypothetical protein